LQVHSTTTTLWEVPFDAVIREVAEETGCDAKVERLLGVDTRMIPAAGRSVDGADHQNVGVLYQVRLTGGRLRPEPNGETAGSAWTRLPTSPACAAHLSSTLASPWHRPFRQLATSLPVPVGGLIQH
jgi:8-oxo-dGTP diphosphatase